MTDLELQYFGGKHLGGVDQPS